MAFENSFLIRHIQSDRIDERENNKKKDFAHLKLNDVIEKYLLIDCFEEYVRINTRNLGP